MNDQTRQKQNCLVLYVTTMVKDNTDNDKKKQSNSGKKNASFQAIFEDENEEYAEAFRDKVLAIHEHFDTDKDGYLHFEELSKLQVATSGTGLDGDQYVMVCRALECRPNKGIPVEALRLTYAADGTNVGTSLTERVLSNPKRKGSRIYVWSCCIGVLSAVLISLSLSLSHTHTFISILIAPSIVQPIDEDYDKIFGKSKDENNAPTSTKTTPATKSEKVSVKGTKQSEPKPEPEEEKVYEAGADGFDISS